MLKEWIAKVLNYEEVYQKGYEAGYAKKEAEALKDEKRRLEFVAMTSYDLGAEHALAKHGIVEIDDLKSALEALEGSDNAC